MRRLRLVTVSQLMAAGLLCLSSCGRLGYEEHSRMPGRTDAGAQPAPDDDAGDP